ncbi:hypothetical protein GF378_00805 [Candidatus Pacearchaeota archaeon]|nr:hypothetical protein [Candidatus Pacearchaeota archaeon]
MTINLRLNLYKKVLSLDGSSLKLDSNLKKAEFEKNHSAIILEYSKGVDYYESSSIYSWIQNFENGHHFHSHCDYYDEEGSIIGLWSDDKEMDVEIIERKS